MSGAAVPLGCALVSAACVAPWKGISGDLPGVSRTEPPNVPGFAVSRFAALLSAAARHCLGEPGSGNVLIGGSAERTAVVLGSVFADSMSLDTAGEQLAQGRLPSPVLSYQAVPTSALATIASAYGITGPVWCVSEYQEMSGTLLRITDDLLAQDDVDQVLLMSIELAATGRVRRICRHLADVGVRLSPPRDDTAVALLIRRSSRPPESLVRRHGTADGPGANARSWGDFGVLGPLVGLCVSFNRGELAASGGEA